MLSLEEQESSQCLVVGAYAMQAALSTIPYFSKPQANRGSAITISPFLGSSEEVQKILSVVYCIKDSSISVLLTGPSGVGKDHLARLIHSLSPRKDKPFVVVNCANIPETLFEEELFGFKRGSFTGADHDKPGLFEIAFGGTIFLDEIADLPLSLQPKILRVLQENEFRPIGGNERVNTDIRIIAATNQNLEKLMQEKKFREDLFYRINAMEITIPSLNERREDIEILMDHYLNALSDENQKPKPQLSAQARQKMLDYPWVGNVRELKNVLERLILFAKKGMIEEEDLALQEVRQIPVSIPLVSPTLKTLEEVENEHVVLVLQAARGNRSKAAKILGIGRRTLYAKLGKLR
ncbi:MAG: hypothetical protein A3G32_04680 [Deltaproteobacteria bacterium RIFCSPLOWO2_12_FULL_40_28]|nr:MAG: hypothetical protein A3C45_08790 [Deltaproteobacteria bacterium RIFCSPHIGHO2_02_FULL_40_28]OGQ19665.1 MAG: hypothetical protein A3E27_07985 [Deltaproteobacteria bacterium RIFCSPHIGHO2_12_FULL_40_32]OGQ40942.1 MAG: hypothetical protein A3I69_03400 [Deltaproteobacteria bacterium RIFCSPLOWO2_02_FULL_40_36]OGQ54057.1 MAG: hypothetical protein A3G32_04680 [Deltaproteobacteria bacterium RIFCSPLOWO2_12_FULL_40_28]